MISLNIRVEQRIYARMKRQARQRGITLSARVRAVLERAGDRDETAVEGLEARLDELLATLLQTYIVLATSVAARAPDLLKQAHEETRRALTERGLYDPERDN